jgi:hypothetical protein
MGTVTPAVTPTVTTTAAPAPAAVIAPTVDPDIAIIESINKGDIISNSILYTIKDPAKRNAAALQLAKNLVAKGGGTKDAQNQLGRIYTGFFDSPTAGGFAPWAESINYVVKEFVTPKTGPVPWNTRAANSLDQLYGKMNQGFYTTGSSGHYNSLTMLYRDTAAFLTSQNIEPTDQKVYDAMALITQGAAKQTDSTVADEYFWYDKNIEDWRNEGRPVRAGGPATGEILEAVIPSDETRQSQADILDLFEADSSVARADYNADASTAITDTAGTEGVPANLQDVFGTDPDNPNNAANESYNNWIAKGAPGYQELVDMTGGTGTGLPNLGANAVFPDPTASPFTGGVSGPEVGGPANMDIFGQMQTQENFPADVFRRFLAEQVSPGTGELQALSPFMMRGAQDLAPQLMSEYNASIYDPSNWSDAGSQSTFGDWLRAGQRPTRQGMFNTLQDIGNVVAGGQQGITGPGLSMAEGLRRQNIINQFGTDTADSRKALQGLFSTAALKGVAPAFRYPVQSAAQGLFQTQRALQPEKSFLSFLNERV